MSQLNHDAQVLKSKNLKKTKDENFSGSWINDLDSVMVISQNGQSITGNYTTAVTALCAQSYTAKLIGTINGDLISFVVNWGAYMSITAWVGQMVNDKDGKPVIKTLWQMTNEVEDSKEACGVWASILAGADTFRPV
jgi:hypothetical protein